MTPTDPVEAYLTRLRAELDAAGAADVDDLVAEIRSLLADASAEEPGGAAQAIARLGEPAELARGILAERGLDESSGISSGMWWRLGIAAPLDIAIGLALPLAASIPLFVVTTLPGNRIANVALAVALGVVALAWPFFIWRPWRAGGTPSPGMTLTGLAVVRAPGYWRLVPVAELAARGLAPRRRMALAVVTVLAAAVLLGGLAVVVSNVGRSWLATSASTSAPPTSEATAGPESGPQVAVRDVYTDLIGSSEAVNGERTPGVAPSAAAGLAKLHERVFLRKIERFEVSNPVAVAPNVYRLTVKEQPSEPLGPPSVTTFTVGRRWWSTPTGTASDWVVVGIEPGK